LIHFCIEFQDQFDHFDFSDNEILKLDNFPILKRLASVTLNNNKISVIGEGLGAQLPKLDTLLLTNNRLSQFSELEPLGGPFFISDVICHRQARFNDSFCFQS
jgi:Leucine-rich repeat (LRR) protein